MCKSSSNNDFSSLFILISLFKLTKCDWLMCFWAYLFRFYFFFILLFGSSDHCVDTIDYNTFDTYKFYLQKVPTYFTRCVELDHYIFRLLKMDMMEICKIYFYK